MPRKPRLFCISGPSGTGKGTLVEQVRSQRPDLGLTVSATTRAPRPGEIEGVSYYFMSQSEYEERVAAGEFLEWAEVHGHYYGTLKSEVNKNLDDGRSVILEIDVQGALYVKKVFPETVLIFIEPPSMENLEARLRGRGTEDEKDIELRLSHAAGEMKLAELYDVRIVNDDLCRATNELLQVLDTYEMN